MNKREEEILYKNIFGRSIAEEVLAKNSDEEDPKGHAESTWECAEHVEETGVITQTGITFEDIALAGVPICHVCGQDMVLVEEEWVE